MRLKRIQEELNDKCSNLETSEIERILKADSIDLNYDEGLPLILAIRSIQEKPNFSEQNCLATLKLLVENGADIHINNDFPLYLALTLDNHAAVKYLVSNDEHFAADPNLIDDYLKRNQVDFETEERLLEVRAATMKFSF